MPRPYYRASGDAYDRTQPPHRPSPQDPHGDRRGVVGASGRPRRAPGDARGPRLRRGGEEDLRLHRRARGAAPVPGGRGARGTDAVPQAAAALHRRPHVARLAEPARAVRFADAVRERRGVRDGQAVHRHQLGRPATARRRRDARAPGARAGPRDERPRPVPHHPRPDPQRELRVAPVPRRNRPPPDPDRAARVVPQERAVVRSRRVAREPGRNRFAPHVPQDGRRGRHVADGSERLPRPGEGVRGDGRRLGPHLPDLEHPRPQPPVQHAARGRAAALDRSGRVRPHPARGVHAPRARGRRASPRARPRRGARALHEGSQSRRERRRGYGQAGRPGVHGHVQEEVRILVVGGGGREHALCWALKRDTPDATLFTAPGNPGTAALGTNLGIPATAAHALVATPPSEPLVVKASGLAGGKGAVVCVPRAEAQRTARAMLGEGAFGDAGREIVVEEFLAGEELSVLALTDGERIVILPPVQDHKRLLEGDAGPNTGGMGAYCPVGLVTGALLERVRQEVLEPTLREMAARGAPYQGVLYAGLMLAPDGTPYVLEFNCRFGDPEAQTILPVLPRGTTQHLTAIATGGWRPEHDAIPATGAAVTTVLAAHGYPDRPEVGAAIELPRDLGPDVLLFHAGTARDPDGTLRVAGGRVLAVTGLAASVAAAAERSAAVAARIAFEGKAYRRDIGWREVARAGTP